MPGPSERLERSQVPLYLGAMAVGALAGALAPGAGAAAPAVTPALALMLFATFVTLPLDRFTAALRSGRFLLALAVVDFVVAPLVAFGLSRIVASDAAVTAGVLLVLLTPCIDYVVVFTRLAGGSSARLLATTPLLLVTQMALLPLFLWLFAGERLAGAVHPGPFVEAFIVLIAIPLAAAVVVRTAARRGLRAGAALQRVGGAAAVPLTALVLLIAVFSQSRTVLDHLPEVAVAVALFVAFGAIMTAAGALASRAFRLDVADGRAVLFSGVTRNSLVVLPFALALPPGFEAAPVVVVSQTLVELILMVALVTWFRVSRERSHP